MYITVKCLQCGQEFSVRVDEQEYQDYIESNTPTEQTFPTLHEVDRRLVQSHVCARCWDSLFGVEPE